MNVQRRVETNRSLAPLLITIAAFVWGLSTSSAQEVDDDTTSKVGMRSDGSVQTPQNYILRPYGTLIDLPNLRPQAVVVSPDGKFAVLSGRTAELLVLDLESNTIKERVAFPNEDQSLSGRSDPIEKVLQPDKDSQISFGGLAISADGRWIYLSSVSGSIKVFENTGGQMHASHTIPLPAADAPRRTAEIPAGLAVDPSGRFLYVCGNLSNQLLEVDVTTGDVTRRWPVGVAPYGVVLSGEQAFVTNWGGRRPGPDDLTGPAGRGTVVKVDPIRFIASEGSVSVIDLAGDAPTRDIIVALHPSQIVLSPDQRWLVCANAASDTLSVIDANGLEVEATIWMKAKPADLFGAAPNALTFDPEGKFLYVANGSQNAVGVVQFDSNEPEDSKLIGLIPVGWYPGAIDITSSGDRLVVANLKGLPATPRRQRDGTEGFNSHHHQGSISTFAIPNGEELAMLSQIADRCLRKNRLQEAALPPRPNVSPRPIPERIGEPSLLKHVVYIIRENRTYDQVLGDLPRGRGRADLCIFGREITPNTHKLAESFVLLDNTYCAGILSADGHQWSTAAISTDYLEKSFSEFTRSYPDGMDVDEADALAYSPAGFLWDNAILHGKTLRNYGEFMIPKFRWRDPNREGRPGFVDGWKSWKGESDEVIIESEPAIESIRPYSPTATIGWEMSVPDQFRADFFLTELKEFEEKGHYPELVLVCLPNDHTSGTSPNCPTPRACIADNDLALGRIIEGLTHSKFWPEMAIFVIEDDPQAGWDHISGFRTVALCVSPYAVRETTVSTQYNTTSIIRTIEQILGLPPMNQFDASALPMFDCFTDQPNMEPYQHVPASISLTEMNPNPSAILDLQLREDAIVSSQLNFREIDRAPEDVLNRILWRAQRGTSEPYPQWAITHREIDDDD